ncbi:MoaD/ThiS family protein [Blastococcus sp. CCUG 61487]|uniref:MoaD/ThiS family protein n=1 Tax=Blastococcus sp. CCUG 61487 TaxID=1840703 RepID=UPI0010C015B2|nr:MoaD/ThiS family protein [Blastococcus sp. CCUG 61487]TKJ34888.1 hypothetical protein A6V29_14760 [Blastococcus sp. CCUG 61487]
MGELVQVILQPPLDSFADDGEDTLEIPASTVGEAVRSLCQRNVSLAEKILVDGALSPHIHIFHNGKLVPAEACETRRVENRDEVCLLTAIRGG